MAAPGAVSGKKSLQASLGVSVINHVYTVFDSTCRQHGPPELCSNTREVSAKTLQASFGSVGNHVFTVFDNTCRQPAFSMDSIATSGAVSGKQPCRQALVVANTCKLCFYVPDVSQGFLL